MLHRAGSDFGEAQRLRSRCSAPGSLGISSEVVGGGVEKEALERVFGKGKTFLGKTRSNGRHRSKRCLRKTMTRHL